MSRKIFRADGFDVELVRQQLALNPPDAGTGIDIEYDDEGKATLAWTHAGQRCSVGTAIVIVDVEDRPRRCVVAKPLARRDHRRLSTGPPAAATPSLLQNA